MRVPFLDLQAHHQPLESEFQAAMREVIASGAFAGGPFVSRFEAEFAAYCHTRFCVGVGSGTEALWLSLLALGVGPGDEVITAPNSFIATAEAISFCGAKPIFVDVDERTYALDPDLLEAAITPRTQAIIPVHLFGQMAEMDRILAIAKKHGIPVVEDACQAHGAEYQGNPAGSMGVAGCFSFYPGKNLGAFGEAGAIVTSDPFLAATLMRLRDHGQERKYHHSMVGWNARMDGIQAAVLSVKLKYLDAHNSRRRQCAEAYDELLDDCDDVVLPHQANSNAHVYHLYAVRSPRRDQLLQRLTERGIGCGIHYPVPIHRQPAYAHLRLPLGSYPVAEQCARELVSLPMYPELTRPQIEAVVAEIRELLAVENLPLAVTA